ncbi:MAG: hypothetical protein WBD00_07690 [Candidatus Omnitrophota bacterium]|jgi:hypothetical protein
MKKKFVQSCNMSGRTRANEKKSRPSRTKVSKKALTDVYNKFYRDQVTALYRAINND